MTAVARTADEVAPRTSRHSLRLKALSDEATAIREMHGAGKITSEEAAEKLERLKRRYAGLFERLLDL